MRNNIKKIRLKHHMSQDELADKIGEKVTKQAVSSWETGYKEFTSLKYAIKMADIFGVSVDYILGREKAEKNGVAKMEPIKMTFKNEWTSKLKNKIDKLQEHPTLKIFISKPNEATEIYLKNKLKYGKKLGINVETVDVKGFFDIIDILCEYKDIDPLFNSVPQYMLQQPVNQAVWDTFKRIMNESAFIFSDVEGINSTNQNVLKKKAINGRGNLEKSIIPCTIAGNLKLINEYLPGFSYEGKVVLVIGRSEIVGTPAADAFESLNCTVIKANSKTKNLNKLCEMADIIVSCVGKPNLVTTCKEGAVLIDNGVSIVDGHQHGDISKKCWEKSLAYTPWINATGKATVHCLFENYYKNCVNRDKAIRIEVEKRG